MNPTTLQFDRRQTLLSLLATAAALPAGTRAVARAVAPASLKFTAALAR